MSDENDVNNIFSYFNMISISREIGMYMPLLYNQDFYKQNQNAILELEHFVSSRYLPHIVTKFREYEVLETQKRMYQNCISYYAGLNKGLSLGRGKNK